VGGVHTLLAAVAQTTRPGGEGAIMGRLSRLLRVTLVAVGIMVRGGAGEVRMMNTEVGGEARALAVMGGEGGGMRGWEGHITVIMATMLEGAAPLV